MNSSEIIKELNFKAIRSSGAGGQHVNKVSSKIELTFDLEKLKRSFRQRKRIFKNKAFF